MEQTAVWYVDPSLLTPAATRRSQRVRRFRKVSLITLLATIVITLSGLAGIAFSQRHATIPARAAAHRSDTANLRPFPTAPAGGALHTNPITVADTDPASVSSPVAAVANVRAARLIIPVIGVDAPVEVKGLDENSEMQTPDRPFDVVWYDFSGQPGVGGNAVFAGHLDYHDVGPAVFWDLAKVSQGDVIQVRMDDGTQFEYRVTATATFDEKTAPVHDIIAPTTEPSITLITCAGTFDKDSRAYDQRLIVRAQAIPAATP